MTRLKAVSPDQAKGKTKDLFNAVEKKLGVVPNMMRTMGNSTAFREGYLQLGEALGQGSLGGKTGELIALAVAESNGCDYCLSAHTYLGKNVYKLDDAAMIAARNGKGVDPKNDAILQFVKIVVRKNGQVTADEVKTLQDAGLSDGEIGEVVGHVAYNILTNYFNLAAGTEIDFPVVTQFTKEEALTI